MKKLLILLIMFSLAFAVFAQEAEVEAPAQEPAAPAQEASLPPTGTGKGFVLEVTANIPVHWTDAEDHPSGLEDKTVSTATALGLALNFNFSRKWGFIIDADISFARALYGDPGVPAGNKNSDFGSLMTANVLLGPVVYLYSGSFLKVPLAFGVHYYFYSKDHWDYVNTGWWQTSDHQFGPGLYIGIQFHFTKNIYIVSRATLSLDIARYHTEKGGAGTSSLNEFELVSSFGVKPTIGMGIKF